LIIASRFEVEPLHDGINALNGNAGLQENSAFGAWRQPTEIPLARFVRLSVRFDF
jgi:hypothetical protein